MVGTSLKVGYIDERCVMKICLDKGRVVETPSSGYYLGFGHNDLQMISDLDLTIDTFLWTLL